MSDINDNELLQQDEFIDDDSTKDLFLCFEIDDEQYAIDIIYVKEIINIFTVTPVPETPRYVKGIINLRGDIAPVINVRLRFGKPEKDVDDNTCIIVLYTNDMIIGLIVDSVSGSMVIPSDDIQPAPSAKLNHINQFVKNVGKTEEGAKLLLDVEKLLFS